MSPAAERNKTPILEILKLVFQKYQPKTVLEIGSGFGQHADHFTQNLPDVQWIPTEVPENLETLTQALKATSPQVLSPLPLDVTNFQHWENVFQQQSIQWIYTANTFHIMPWGAVKKFWEAVHARSDVQGVFVYGPFLDGKVETASSNWEFDQSLKARIPGAGLRHLEAVADLAKSADYQMTKGHFMPANNRVLIFQRSS